MSRAQVLEVIYVESGDSKPVLVTIGDTVRAQDWARDQYPDDLTLQEQRAGLYAVYLGAKRAGLPGTGLGWLEWLDQVTIPDDETEDETPEPGESEGPPSEL